MSCRGREAFDSVYHRRLLQQHRQELIVACIKVVQAMVMTSGGILDTFLELIGLKINDLGKEEEKRIKNYSKYLLGVSGRKKGCL